MSEETEDIEFVYPIKLENQIVAAVRNGDKEQAILHYNKLINQLIASKKNDLNYIQMRTFELIVLLARTCVHAGNKVCTDISEKYFKRILAIHNVGEINIVIHSMIGAVINQIVHFQSIPHGTYLKRAVAYIKENIERKITLAELGKVSGLSPTYLSSVFKLEMGEHFTHFVNRLRLQKAAQLLEDTDFTCSQIGRQIFIKDTSWFSKLFKQYYGISPLNYRRQKFAERKPQ